MKTKTERLFGESRFIYFAETLRREPEIPASPRKEKLVESIEREKTPESITNAPHTIADVLKATEKFLGQDLSWDLPNGEKLEKSLPRLREELSALNQVLESRAELGKPGVAEINKFLEEKGFSIRLDQNQVNELTISAASVLKLEGQWSGDYKPERVDKFKLASQKEVPAVKMKKVASYTITGHNHPIIKLQTEMEGTGNQSGFGAKKGPCVYITRFDGEVPKGASGLYQKTTEWMREIGQAQSKEADVTIPQIDYQKSGDIKELLQGSTVGQDGLPAVIGQAKFEHILKMNEKGFLAQAAAAIMLSRGMDINTRKEIKIDGPFIMWVEQGTVSAFSAYISEKDMKDPGNFQQKEKK